MAEIEQMTIRMRKHARSGAVFSELALGNASWGNLAGAEGDAQAAEVLALAWEKGVRYFDTAPYYGGGLCETRLGNGLRWMPRSEFLLSSKVGIELDPHNRRPALAGGYVNNLGFGAVCDYSADGIARSLDASLHRLGMPRLDLAFMHGMSVCPNGAVAALETGMPALLGLRDQGLLSMAGLGANSAELALEFVNRFDLDILLFASGFSLADHAGAEPVLRACRDRGIAVLAAAPFANGRYFAPANAEFRQRLGLVCARFGVSEMAAVMQFGLLETSVTSVLWSTGTPDNLRKTVAAYHEVIPPDFWGACHRAGLVSEYVNF